LHREFIGEYTRIGATRLVSISRIKM